MYIEDLCAASINELEALWKIILENGLQNEQYVLDFLDKLNEISVRN